MQMITAQKKRQSYLSHLLNFVAKDLTPKAYYVWIVWDGEDLFQKNRDRMGGKGQLFAEGVAQTWEGALCLKLKNTHSVNREYSDGGCQTFYCSNPHSGEKSSRH